MRKIRKPDDWKTQWENDVDREGPLAFFFALIFVRRNVEGSFYVFHSNRKRKKQMNLFLSPSTTDNSLRQPTISACTDAIQILFPGKQTLASVNRWKHRQASVPMTPLSWPAPVWILAFRLSRHGEVECFTMTVENDKMAWQKYGKSVWASAWMCDKAVEYEMVPRIVDGEKDIRQLPVAIHINDHVPFF